MADLERELGEIRREVIESRNLVIRTDNQLKTLHAELKAVARRQEEAHRKQRLASAAAYGLFALLAVGAGVVVSVVLSAVAAHERRQLGQSLAEASTALEQARGQAAATAGASRTASELYRNLSEGSPEDRLKAVAALSRLEHAPLSVLERRVLEEKAASVRRELGAAALERGRQAVRRGDVESATDELTRFLALDPPEAEAVEASFLLGAVQARNGHPAEAIPLLSRVVDKDRRPRVREEAMALLAQAYQQAGKPDRAAEVARMALETAPASPWAPAYKSRLAAARRAAADAGLTTGADGGLGLAEPRPAASPPTPPGTRQQH